MGGGTDGIGNLRTESNIVKYIDGSRIPEWISERAAADLGSARKWARAAAEQKTAAWAAAAAASVNAARAAAWAAAAEQISARAAARAAELESLASASAI